MEKKYATKQRSHLLAEQEEIPASEMLLLFIGRSTRVREKVPGVDHRCRERFKVYFHPGNGFLAEPIAQLVQSGSKRGLIAVGQRVF